MGGRHSSAAMWVELAEALAAEREGESASHSRVWQQDGALLQTQKGTSRYSVRVFSSDRPTYRQIDNQPWQAAHWRRKDTIIKHLQPRRQGGGHSARGGRSGRCISTPKVR